MSTTPPTLSPGQITDFHRQGFLSIPSLAPPDEVAHIIELLDGLYARFDELPPELAFDLGDVKHHRGAQRSPQINSPSRFEPRLLDTPYFHRALAVARQLLGDRAVFRFDHTIYKPPGNERETPWHQDIAYGARHGGRPAYRFGANFWLALQDTPVEMGCMQFVPGSHQGDMLPHHPIGYDPRIHTLETTEADVSAARACPLPLGGATVHHPKTLHYTGPNRSGHPRRAWIVVFDAPVGGL